MAEPRTWVSIFAERPRQWNLRGDPHLWGEMEGILRDRPLPGSEEELVRLIETGFEFLTGAPITGRDPVYVPRLAHGGMSSGCVNPVFWRETLLPLFRQRYREGA